MALIDKLINDDFVWNAISPAIAGRARRQRRGSFTMNCPMCVMRGESRPDTKKRLGIWNNHPGVGFNCMNCKAHGRWVPGDTLNKNMRELMESIGIPEIDVKRINHKAATYRRLFESNPNAQALVPATFSLDFPSRSLPEGAASFEEWAKRGCTDPKFLEVVEYLYGRGDEIAAASAYYWSPVPGDHNMDERVIVPFYRNEKLVGWTGRAVNDTIAPKYHNDNPSDYLFNNHVMDDRDRKYVIIAEGPFDALAIDGISPLGSKLNDKQAAWIDSTGKIPILIPDPDKAGQNLIDIALKRGWRVAFPRLTTAIQKNWWDLDVKDCADAVKKYGRLYTLSSILKTAAFNKIEIETKRRML